MPGRGAETCSRGVLRSHPSSPLTVRGTPGTRSLLGSMGYTSSQNSTSLSGAASRREGELTGAVFVDAPGLAGRDHHLAAEEPLGLVGPLGDRPGPGEPGTGYSSGRSPGSAWGTGAALAGAVVEGAGPPAAPVDGDGCRDPLWELHAAPSSPAARINATMRFISSP